MSATIVCDLRTLFGEVRDQGSRPTCLAFAVSDVHGASFTPFHLLSTEYLYYHAVNFMPGRNAQQGINTTAVGQTLLTTGQPSEHLWPYQINFSGTTLQTPIGSYSLHKKALATDKVSFDDICKSLDSRCPVVICLELSESFYKPQANGFIELKTPDPMTGRHAVIAVGHGGVQKERYLLVRNSWGSGWGINGHAFLREHYVISRLISTSRIT